MARDSSVPYKNLLCCISTAFCQHFLISWGTFFTIFFRTHYTVLDTMLCKLRYFEFHEFSINPSKIQIAKTQAHVVALAICSSQKQFWYSTVSSIGGRSSRARSRTKRRPVMTISGRTKAKTWQIPHVLFKSTTRCQNSGFWSMEIRRICSLSWLN